VPKEEKGERRGKGRRKEGRECERNTSNKAATEQGPELQKYCLGHAHEKVHPEPRGPLE
jgi:hypothetical protein